MKQTTRIRAVLFDFDGTVTAPGAIDFNTIKEEIGCPPEATILEFIDQLPEHVDIAAKEKANAVLAKHERKAVALSVPNAGIDEIIAFIRGKGLKVGIITRNLMEHVVEAFANFPNLGPDDFDVIITRDADCPPKPAPDGVILAADGMDISARQIMVVGDYLFDIHAGNAAGAVTVFLSNGGPVSEAAREASDYVVESLAELRKVVRLYLPLPAGKFPNDLLREFLDEFRFDDPSVIIRPGIGEDTAAVDVSGEQTLILKSDPITFATDAISQYAVLINANDIATSGATPRWLLTTFLFPCGMTPVEIFEILRELETVCRRWKITLCGGHTEITDAVTRPVVSGMLCGTVPLEGLIDKQKVRPGDRVLLTKGVAVEGTTIITREFAHRLRRAGMSEEEIEAGRALLSRISVLDEARIAARNPGTTAMHDVTEGGLATALQELSIASGHRIKVYVENIPLLPETETVCRLMEIHPLGLIGSGSLLICCREDATKELIAAIATAGIQVTYIGEVVEAGEGIAAVWEGQPAEWPSFEVDEIARLFE